jgi:UPF0716 family protein affecting phage T7 exclusion
VVWRLFLLIVLVPAVELFLLIKIGSLIGPMPTLLLVLVSGIVGAALARREGVHLLGELSNELRQGIPPGERLMEGVLVVTGGLLLVIPGVLTDIVGVLLMVRPTRRWLAPRVLQALASRFDLDVKLGADAVDAARADAGDAGDDKVRHRRDVPARRAEPHPFASPFD